MRAALGYGLTSMAAAVFWCLFIFAGEEMIERSLDVRYHGPIQAIGDMIRLFLDYARLMAQPDVLIWLVVGALFAGTVTELSARKWS